MVYGFKSIIMAPAVMSDNITHLCSFNFEVLSHAGENVLASLRLLYKGGGMKLIFPVIFIVIVTVIVLLQCLSCSFGQN